MSSFPNDPFLVYKRKGDRTDPFLQYNEPKQVYGGKVVLTEIPDKGNHVTVKDSNNISYAEIYSQATLSANNVYYVDYDKGIVYFDASKEGLTFTFSYLGIGGSYIPATRVYTQSSNGTITQDVQDMIDNYNQLNGTDLYNLFDPQTGHKHTGGAGDAPAIDSQYVTYNNGSGTVSKVKDTLDSHAAQLAERAKHSTNWINVTQSPYSADNTGSTSASSAIQSAINDLSTSGGGYVYLPEGYYKILTSITPQSNVHIIGDGINTVLKQTDSTIFISIIEATVRVENCIFERFSIQGNNTQGSNLTQNQTAGIKLRDPKNCIIRNVISYNQTGHGIYLKGESIYNSVENNFCYGNWQTGIELEFGGLSAEFIPYENKIMFNRSSGNHKNGIDCNLGQRNTFMGNIVIGNGLTIPNPNIEGHGFALLGVSECTFVGNIVKDNPFSGIHIISNTITKADNSVVDYKASKNTVIGNQIKGNGYAGIHIYGGTQNTINGNYFEENGNGAAPNGIIMGAIVVETNTSSNGTLTSGANSLTNNQITRSGSTANVYGVYVPSGVTLTLITGNQIMNHVTNIQNGDVTTIMRNNVGNLKDGDTLVDSQGRPQMQAFGSARTLQTTLNGSTAARPSSPITGQQYFDTTLGKPIWYNGSAWKDATGVTV